MDTDKEMKGRGGQYREQRGAGTTVGVCYAVAVIIIIIIINGIMHGKYLV